MSSLRMLERVLAESVKRNGADKPLTIGHLHNIVRLAIRAEEHREERQAKREQEIMDEVMEDRKWGND